MTINDMRYFIEVAKCKNFSLAAKNLYITHPTLGRQMTKLEEELNMQLFIRTNKGAVLTPAGVELTKVFEKVLLDLDEGISKSRVISQGYSGSLKIGVLSGLNVGSFLQEFLQYMGQKYANIHLDIQQLTHADIVNQLNHYELDIALSVDLTFLKMNTINTFDIKPYNPVFIIPANHPLAVKEKLTYRDLKDEEIVIVKEGDCPVGEEMIVEECMRYGGFRPNFFFAETMENEILWLQSGLKCTILSDTMTLCKSEAVKTYPLEGAEEKDGKVQLAYKTDNNNQVLEAVKAFFS